MTHEGGQRRIATFFGGCVAGSPEEEELAHTAGAHLGRLGYALQHGGYNGLMEHAARGARDAGAPVIAVTLRDKPQWGPLNPYVTESIYAAGMGPRLAYLVDRSDVIIAMGGGVGSLHELTAALWYAGNIRPVPLVLLGATADRLQSFLREERWLYESPTRSLSFLHCIRTKSALIDFLSALAIDRIPPAPSPALEARVLAAASVDAPYQLAGGRVLPSYFDPFRLADDPALAAELAVAMAGRVPDHVDAVAGLELGGVVLGANVAAAMGRPLLLVRKSAKTYGTFARVEGVVRPGARVLLVDDVVRSGGQMLDAAEALTAAGLVVTDALCVVERTEAGRARLLRQGISLLSLITTD